MQSLPILKQEILSTVPLEKSKSTASDLEPEITKLLIWYDELIS